MHPAQHSLSRNSIRVGAGSSPTARTLPLIAFDGAPPTLAHLRDYARHAAGLGYRYLCANDHLLFQRPWLDGPTALAATLDAAAGMTFATTVALPVIRGPVQTAKLLVRARPAHGRLADRGRRARARRSRTTPPPASPFDQRWPRFEEAVRALRALAGRERAAVRRRLLLDRRPDPRTAALSTGRTAAVACQLGVGGRPAPGRTARRRVAGLRLQHHARSAGSPAAAARSVLCPTRFATTWLYVTDDQRAAERMLTDVLAPLLRRTRRDPPRAHAPDRLSRALRAGDHRLRASRRRAGLRLAAHRPRPPGNSKPSAPTSSRSSSSAHERGDELGAARSGSS